MNTQVIERTELQGAEHAPIDEGTLKPSLVDRIRQVFESVRDWHRYRSAVRELSLLDDARLTDIGIVRSQIGSVVRQAMQEKKERVARSPRIMRRAA